MAHQAAPSQIIRADEMTREENYDQWRASLASLFEARPIDGSIDNFSADLKTYNLGHFILGTSNASPQTFAQIAAWSRSWASITC